MATPLVTGEAIIDIINPAMINIASVYNNFNSFIDGAIAFALFFSVCHWVFTKRFQGREGKMIALAMGAALTFGFVVFEMQSGFRFGGPEMQGIAGMIFLFIMAILLYELLSSMLGPDRKLCAVAGSYFISHSILFSALSPLYQTVWQAAPLIVSIFAIGYVIAIVQVIRCMLGMFGAVGSDTGGGSSSSGNSSNSSSGSGIPGLNGGIGGDNSPLTVEIIEPLTNASFNLGTTSMLQARATGMNSRGAILRATAPSVQPNQGRAGWFRPFRATLQHITPGEQTITVEALTNGGGHATRSVNIRVVEGGILQGVAVDNTGVPIKDALMRVVLPGATGATAPLRNYRNDPLEARTDSDGRFTLQFIPFATEITVIGVSPTAGIGHLYIPRVGVGVAAASTITIVPAQPRIENMQVLFQAPLSATWNAIAGLNPNQSLYRLSTGVDLVCAVSIRGGTRRATTPGYTVVWQLEPITEIGGRRTAAPVITLATGSTETEVDARERRANITFPAASFGTVGLVDGFYRIQCRIQDALTPTPASTTLTADIQIGTFTHRRLSLRIQSYNGHILPNSNSLPVLSYSPSSRSTIGVEVTGGIGAVIIDSVAATLPGQPTVLWTNTRWTPPIAGSTVGTLELLPYTGTAQMQAGQYDVTVQGRDSRGDTEKAQLTVLVSSATGPGATTTRTGSPAARITQINGGAVGALLTPVNVRVTSGGIVTVEITTSGLTSPTVEGYIELQPIDPSTRGPAGGAVNTGMVGGTATGTAGVFVCDIVMDARVFTIMTTLISRGIPFSLTVHSTVTEGSIVIPIFQPINPI